MAIKNMTIRIDEKLLLKLHILADYEGRSANPGKFWCLFGRPWKNTKKNMGKSPLAKETRRTGEEASPAGFGLLWPLKAKACGGCHYRSIKGLYWAL